MLITWSRKPQTGDKYLHLPRCSHRWYLSASRTKHSSLNLPQFKHYSSIICFVTRFAAQSWHYGWSSTCKRLSTYSTGNTDIFLMEYVDIPGGICGYFTLSVILLHHLLSVHNFFSLSLLFIRFFLSLQVFSLVVVCSHLCVPNFKV